MEKDKLKKLVEEFLSLKEISELEKVSKTTVRYWLKKYGLKTKRGAKGKLPKDYILPRKCSCGETNPDNFYGNKRTVCAKCHCKYTNKRNQDMKVKAVAYKGGKCTLCGFNKYTASLDFHHLNPDKKDPKFSGFLGWSWERIKKEIDKCELLCRNCHSALHSNQIIWSEFEEKIVRKLYNGV